MEDPNPELSRLDRFSTELGYLAYHFSNGFFREHNDYEEINNEMFNDAIQRIKEKNYLDTNEDLKKNNKAMRIYLEALLKTLKNKINLFDPEIQDEIKRNSDEILAQEDAPVFEIRKQRQENDEEKEKEKRPRFKGWNKDKLDALSSR
jgi:hypothetical protein